MVAQGREGVKRSDYPAAVQAFQSAVALLPNDEGFRELAQAKAAAEQAAHARALAEQQQRETLQKQERDAALARVDQERRKREAEETVRRKAQQERDDREYQRLVGVAREALTRQQYDAASAAVGAARQVKAGPEVDALQRQIHDELALADARKKSDQARLEEEKRQAAERKRREEADAETRRKQEQYNAALTRAQKALNERNYDLAIAAYDEAGKLFRTDLVVSGVKQAAEMRDRDRAARSIAEQKKNEEEKKAVQLKKLLAEGQKALDARQFDQAIQLFRDASKQAPGNVDVLTALSKAQVARDEFDRANRSKVDMERAQKIKGLLADARRGLIARDFKLAEQSLAEAVKLAPTDPEVVKTQQELAVARKSAADAEMVKQRKASYDLAMGAGAAALKSRDYQSAVHSFTEALRQLPGDKDAERN